MKNNYFIFDTLLEPIFILNSEQKVVYCNEAAALIAGLSVRKISKGIDFFSLFSFTENIWENKNIQEITTPSSYKEVSYTATNGDSGAIQIMIQPLPEDNSKSPDGSDEEQSDNSQAKKLWIIFIRDVTLEQRLQKKYRNELQKKEDVIQALNEAHVQLENYSKNLEGMVVVRTAEIQYINQLMTALLDSLTQGFFIFNKDGKILEFSSKACEFTIECKPQGKYIWEVLKLPENKILGFKKWIQVLFSGALSFEELAPLGTKEYPHSEKRNITLEYFPLSSDMGELEGVVVVASDITSLIEAQRLSEQEKNHSKLIINLIRNKKNIGRFIRESKALICEMHTTLTVPAAQLNAECLFRQIHTLKGSAGILSIQQMIESCHYAETLLQKFKENPTASALQELQAESHIIDSNFSDFVKMSEEILGLNTLSSERQIEIPISKLKQTLTKAELANSPMTELFLNDFILESIGNFFVSFNIAAEQMAKKTDKLINPIELCNADLKILPEAYSSLFSSFIHAIGNAIDHGIETPAVRELNNKSAAGNIKISFEHSKNNRLTVCVEDDGAGIDAEKIRLRLNSKGIKNSHESDSEVIQHIFDSQFSTREQVTVLSGRGVGMDAIRHAAEALGGSAWVTSECKKGTSLFVEVPFINTFEYEKIKLAS